MKDPYETNTQDASAMLHEIPDSGLANFGWRDIQDQPRIEIAWSEDSYPVLVKMRQPEKATRGRSGAVSAPSAE